MMIIYLIVSIIDLIRGVIFSIGSCVRANKVSPIINTKTNKRTTRNKYWTSKVHPSSDGEDGQGLLGRKKSNKKKTVNPEMASA